MYFIIYLLLYYFRETTHIFYVCICQHSFPICALSLWTDLCVFEWQSIQHSPFILGLPKYLCFLVWEYYIQWIDIQWGLRLDCFFHQGIPTIIWNPNMLGFESSCLVYITALGFGGYTLSYCIVRHIVSFTW